jgi:hypothetical protein
MKKRIYLPKNTKARFWIILDIILRLFAVSLMWWNVLWGFLINGFLDDIDGDILAAAGVKRKWYQRYDKILDTWWCVAIYVYSLLYLQRDLLWNILIISIMFRFIGSVLFILTNKEWILMAFPSIFNWIFFLIIIYPGSIYLNENIIYSILALLIIFAFWKEWKLHITKIDMTHFIFPFKPVKTW